MLSPFACRKSRVVAGEAGHVVEQRLDLVLLRHERVAGDDGVAQQPGELGHDALVGRRDLAELLEALDQLRELRVGAAEVAVERLEALADLLAATLQRVGDRGQRVVELGRLHRAQQRVDVGEDLLDLDRDVGRAGSCRRPGSTSPAGLSGTTSETYFSPNSVLGRISAVTFVGIVSRLVGVEAERQLGAVGGDVGVLDLADDARRGSSRRRARAATGRSSTSSA